MVKFLSNWGQGIIVAVIIGTIIEMLIPAEGGIKKYVKQKYDYILEDEEILFLTIAFCKLSSLPLLTTFLTK